MDKQRMTWNKIAEKYLDQWIYMQIRTGNIQTIYTIPENL